MSIAKIGCHKPSARRDIRCILLYLSDEIHDSDINLVAIPDVTAYFPHTTPGITKTDLRTAHRPVFILRRHLKKLNLQIR